MVKGKLSTRKILQDDTGREFLEEDNYFWECHTQQRKQYAVIISWFICLTFEKNSRVLTIN